MRTSLLTLGSVLLCLSFMFQGIAVAQLIKVREFAVSTEPAKPTEVFAPIGSAFWLNRIPGRRCAWGGRADCRPSTHI